MAISICFDSSSLTEGPVPGKVVTGVIYLEFADRAFPAYRWRDFVVVIVGWWLGSIASIRSHAEASVMLRFMEGPYWIELSQAKGEYALLQCIEDDVSEKVVWENVVRLAELDAQVRDLARQVLIACREHQFASKDIDVVEAFLAESASQ